MALEGLNVGFNMRAVRAERKEEAKKAEPKIKLNFKTTKKKGGPINRESVTIDWCRSHTESDIAEMWKRLFIRKTLTPGMVKQYDDICYYMTQTFNCKLPKRQNK